MRIVVLWDMVCCCCVKDCCRGYSGVGTVGWGSVVRIIPGEVGFDPCGAYPKDEQGQANMRLSEIKHDYLAMVAITVFAAQRLSPELLLWITVPYSSSQSGGLDR